MIRVLFVEHKQVFGGGQVSLLSLLEGLDKKIVRAVVVCQPGAALIGELEKRELDTRVFSLGYIKKSPNPLILLKNLVARVIPTFRLFFIIRRERIDVIYANGTFSFIAAALPAKLGSTPIVWSVHNVTLPMGWATNFLITLADKVVVVTNVIRQQFVGLQPHSDKKIITIYNGVDLSRFDGAHVDRERAKEELGLKDEQLVVGTVGRLSVEKGHRYFLQAAVQIKRAIPAVKFLIVGDGPLRPELESMVSELELEQDIIFTGHRSDIPTLVSLMDVFVLPSIAEAFSIAALEAMALAKPVVAFRVGGVPELVRDGQAGILVEPQDWRKLAEAVLDLLLDAQKRKLMGQQGRKLTEQSFSMEKTCVDTYQVLRDLVKGGASCGCHCRKAN